MEMTSMTVSTARLSLRLSVTDKARIEHAARLRGVTVSALVREAALCEAEAIMMTERVVSLSREESRIFLAALERPMQPAPRLQVAMEAAAKLVQS